jgi:hypothetical protein
MKKDQIYDMHFSKKFQPRKADDFRRTFQLIIYAVGRTVEEALKELGRTNHWNGVYDIKFQTEVDKPCEWYVRFTVGDSRTSMKAAGEYVTGGVIVTWWK